METSVNEDQLTNVAVQRWLLRLCFRQRFCHLMNHLQTKIDPVTPLWSLYLLLSWPIFTLLSLALCLQWDNTVAVYIAVTNMLPALILGNVHSTVVFTCQHACNKCLNSLNCDPYHSTAKHCQMNTFVPDKNITLHWLLKNVLFSKVYASQISE